MVSGSSPPLSLERSVSQQSSASVRSQRSSTVRASRARKLSQQTTSSASSIAASDKSLTSFPSFSPDSPRAERSNVLGSPDFDTSPAASKASKATKTRKKPSINEESCVEDGGAPPVPSAVKNLVNDLVDASSPHRSRNALFEDSPLATQSIPGALHLADDTHIQRLISRHGALGLVRQIATDLAQRDAQIAALRRRADNRERALRKIILECGLSTMDMETRLRSIEFDMRVNGRSTAGGPLSDLMSDAMQDTVTVDAFGLTSVPDATIRASSLSVANQDGSKTATKGWKEFFWGTSTNRRPSRASSTSGDAVPATSRLPRTQSGFDRRPPLQEDLFNPPGPDSASVRSSSRASSVAPSDKKGPASLASLALRLVAGGAVAARDGSVGPGDRSRSASDGIAEAVAAPNSSKTPSVASVRTSQSARTAPAPGGPRALMAMRRTANAAAASAVTRAQQQPERRDGNVGSPPGSARLAQQESYGPVEMDTIVPPEAQPPTLTQHTYNNYGASGFLTDRFGFIYDQRRKKRQRDAARMSRYMKNSRAEMLNSRSTPMSPVPATAEEDQPMSPKPDATNDGARPGSPTSLEDDSKPKRWQDYLNIATFPTELLAHMPTISAPSLEVMEAAETATASKLPGLLTSDDRGFVPTANPTSAVDSGDTLPVSVTPTDTDTDTDTKPIAETDTDSATLVKEDTEPVKLLLQQLNDVHDSLQRDKTMRWNDFLRKVRAERRREGEAAAAAAIATATARFETPAVILPEAKLTDGEMIGISGLGNKGKVGRAKWNEFKSLVLGGIPVTFRSKVWSECSGASALRVPGYYDDLVTQPPSEDDATVVAQIEMDIHRTLTDNIFFRKGPGVARLNQVLLAYARRNPEVGYCQGMNLITANLLLIMPSAEDAFWILTSIVENILPQGYYDHSLLTSRADQQVLRQYVREVLPRLSQHLDDMGVELEALTFQWFLSVFTDCLSAEALFRVWDVVLCTNDGSTFLFQVALALLKLNESQLLQCEAPAAVYTYINHQMTNHAISIDGLIHASEGLRRVVKREEVEARRAEAVRIEKEIMREREEMRSGKTKTKVTEDGDGASPDAPTTETGSSSNS
ncbi:hypothetical protein jhhlp_008075 [Lomentospora prolificans]|uniref:Rab-GAP TBC domain-containing protein n=1 Tax=Lomentospora prolificans TaxID=41688 RepID=A0A2N3MZF5_9PEZI|nr:hypothetical protein jhhlp_008075 [Lomentospora prolificans]